MKEKILALIKALMIVSVAFLIGTSLAFQGIPLTWNLLGRTVQDSTFYTGRYYQVNDSLRIVTIKDRRYGYYDEYRLQVKRDSIYYFTGVRTYVSTHSSKRDAVNYLRMIYNDERNKRNGSHFK